MKERIEKLCQKYLPRTMELRRILHQVPELGFLEFETNKIIASELDRLNIPYINNVAKTGIVAEIHGGKSGPTIMLRADMDGLPIQEESRCDFKSKHDGRMHACGHDGHMAGLLGAAMVLNDLKDEISGNIKLVFQPSEEGDGGAYPIVEAGILDDVAACFGLHVWPSVKAGKIASKSGPMMASSTAFWIKIIGHGGHGSAPELTIDPIIIGCQVVTNLQNIVSRKIPALTPAVLSVCTVQSGAAFNVIPNEFLIKGTIRTYDEKVTYQILDEIEKITKGIVASYGAKYEFGVDKIYPPLINDNKLFEFSKKTLADTFGEENVVIMDKPVMAAEDFAYYCKKVPSNFFFVGINDDDQKEDEVFLHHPKFFWNEKHLITSMRAFTNLTINFLNN